METQKVVFKMIDGEVIAIFPNNLYSEVLYGNTMVDSYMHIGQHSACSVELIDELGKVVKTSEILQGSTLSIIETDTVYNGLYFLRISNDKESKTFKVIIDK